MRCSLHLASGFAFYIAGDQTEFLGALVQTSGRSGDDDLVCFLVKIDTSLLNEHVLVSARVDGNCFIRKGIAKTCFEGMTSKHLKSGFSSRGFPIWALQHIYIYIQPERQ